MIENDEKKENCVFAGSFDPITKGHENIIDKCLDKYDRVFVAIGDNKDKTPAFSLREREEIVRCAIKDKPRATVVVYADYKDDGYAEFLKSNRVTVYVRGIRSEKDVEYENAYLKKNAELYPFIETVYMSPDEEFINISSTLVREALKNGKDVSEYLSPAANAAVNKIIKNNQKQ